MDGGRHRTARRGPRRPRSPPASAGRGRSHPRLRAHRGRRGAGPLADAASGARPPIAFRVDDDRRRHRPGHRNWAPHVVGRGARAPAHRTRRRAGQRAERQLPHAGRSHAARGAGAGSGGTGHGGTEFGARDRRRPADRGTWRRATWPTKSPAPRAGCRRSSATARSPSSARPRWSRTWAGICALPKCRSANRPRMGSTRRSPWCRSTSSKGLEFDGVVVVEPARIVEEAPQGLRALFVALTRPTQRLTIVHAEPLPESLAAAR